MGLFGRVEKGLEGILSSFHGIKDDLGRFIQHQEQHIERVDYEIHELTQKSKALVDDHIRASAVLANVKGFLGENNIPVPATLPAPVVTKADRIGG